MMNLHQWPAGGMSHVFREKENEAGGLVRKFAKNSSCSCAKFVVIVFAPEACSVIKIPSGHSANTGSFCCALSGDDRAVCGGTMQLTAMSVLKYPSYCHESWDQFVPCYLIGLNSVIQVWTPGFLVAYWRPQLRYALCVN